MNIPEDQRAIIIDALTYLRDENLPFIEQDLDNAKIVIDCNEALDAIKASPNRGATA